MPAVSWDASADDAPPASGGALEVSVLPLTVTEAPTSGEKAVSGMILVQRNRKDVADAVVTLNGTVIPYMGSGAYDVDSANLASLAPGASVTIVATDGLGSRTLTFACPTAIEFTTPASGAVIAQGQTLNVAWAPPIAYTAMRIAGGPILGWFACYTKATGNEVSKAGHGSWFLDLAVGQTTQALAVTDSCRRYLLEIQYPGAMVTVSDGNTYSMGQCAYRHRVLLAGQ